MYIGLLHTHSLLRYLLLIAIIYTLFKAFKGKKGEAYTKADNTGRLATVILAHLQLIVGLILYGTSPLMKSIMKNFGEAVSTSSDAAFFAIYHLVLMLAAIVIITVGSAKAKRQSLDADKHKTIFTWFLIAFIIILIAIPWPFSPLATRGWMPGM